MEDSNNQHNEPARRSEQDVQPEKKESQADILIRLASEITLLRDELNEAYAAIRINEHQEIHKVSGIDFERWLTMKFFLETGKAPFSEAMKQVIRLLETKAVFEGKQYTLGYRVTEQDGIFYYDLGNELWQAVSVRPKKVVIVEESPILFYRVPNMRPQTYPSLNGEGKLSRIFKHVRISKKLDQLLFMIYLVTCLIPNIPHPALIISGEKGAAKTTTARMVRSLIDPAAMDVMFPPSSLPDLTLSLSKNYMLCLDNLESLKPKISDLLCTAVTGGGISKRKLFTDGEEVFLSFKRCLVLNGISMVANRPDLLDRSIILDLDRIGEKDRKEERTIWNEFNEDKPQMIGAAFHLLSKAMAIYPQVELAELFRMADFTRWGYAIAEASGIGGDKFLEAYKANMARSNMEAIEAHPVGSAIAALMSGKPNWRGSVASLRKELELVAFNRGINTLSNLWPKGDHVLSMRLKEVKSNLEQVGIHYGIRNGGTAKFVEITNKIVQ